MQTELQIDTHFQRIVDEINAAINAEEERNGGDIASAFIAFKVMNDHPDVMGADKDWHLCASYTAIRKAAREELNRRKPAGVRPKQGEFETQGFEHLQKRYAVKREGVETHVLLAELTDEEIEAKAQLYEDMGRTCQEHADELRRYARGRSASRSPPATRRRHQPAAPL